MVIQVLGTGCANCKTLEKLTREAASEIDPGIEVVKIDDILRILDFNISRPPALVIDEKVVVSGRIPTSAEIKSLIRQKMKQN